MELCLMIEGQEGVSWDDWTALAAATEEHGLHGLFRSDHYGPVQGAGDGSLDAWTTLAALAARTERIRLGTLVSPVTFRHPSVLAKAVVTVDHVSGGRAELGIGAGWLEAEHPAYGFPFPPMGVRMAMLAEQLEIVHRQWNEDTFSFDGKHYQLDHCRAEFRPVQGPHPPIIVGGQGGPRSVDLAARWADEYDMFGRMPGDFVALARPLADACRSHHREPEEVRMSAMCGVLIGRDEGEVRDRAAALLERWGRDQSPDDFVRGLGESWISGTIEQAAARVRAFAEAGVTRVYLQDHLPGDLEMIALAGTDLTAALT